MDYSSIRVLVLDDEPFTLKLLARMLENLGLRHITLCSSGLSALAMLDDTDKSQPNLILCDLNMPGMDGVQFVRHLVDRHYRGSLILVSGEDDRITHSVERLVQAHHITVLGRLSKPVPPKALMALIAHWKLPTLEKQNRTNKVHTVAELANAIGNGQVVNYYQPKVSVTTGQVVGVEALVRWHQQSGLVVSPDKFISMAEEHGLINQLTRQVIINAVKQAKAWRDGGWALKVAVNVSMENLDLLDFPDFVLDQVHAAGVAPTDIVLEITESRQKTDLRSPLDSLARLRLKRISLSIDDFGTGYSSLAQLSDLPFDELKIDQRFVHRAWESETQRAMYDASLGLANQLGMVAVAEGVEDRQDWDFVQSTQCGLAQGYFIARPMLPTELPAWLDAWERRIPDLLSDTPVSKESI